MLEVSMQTQKVSMHPSPLVVLCALYIFMYMKTAPSVTYAVDTSL